MHGFRDRPLTWLFVAATVCVDLVMVLPVMVPARTFADDVPRWIVSFGVPAQLSLVAVWAATSPASRLARGALLTGAVYLAFLSATLFGFSRQQVILYFFAPTLVVWGGALALGMASLLPGWCPGSTPVATKGMRAFDPQPLEMHRLGDEDRPWKERPWQFSLVELFGWTSVVALWAFALRHADLSPSTWSWLAGMVACPLVTLLLIGGPGPWWMRVCWVLPGIAAALVPLRWAGLFPPSAMCLTQASTLALWYMVLRLDGALETSHVEERNPKPDILNKFE